MHPLWLTKQIAKRNQNIFGDKGKWATNWIKFGKQDKVLKGFRKLSTSRKIHQDKWKDLLKINKTSMGKPSINEMQKGIRLATFGLSKDFSMQDRIMRVLDKSDSLLLTSKGGIFNEIRSLTGMIKETTGINKVIDNVRKKLPVIKNLQPKKRYMSGQLNNMADTYQAAYNSIDEMMIKKYDPHLLMSNSATPLWQHALQKSSSPVQYKQRAFELFHEKSKLAQELGQSSKYYGGLDDIAVKYKAGKLTEAAKDFDELLWGKGGIDKKIAKEATKGVTQPANMVHERFLQKKLSAQERMITINSKEAAISRMGQSVTKRLGNLALKGVFLYDGIKLGIEIGVGLIESAKKTTESIANSLKTTSFGNIDNVAQTDQAVTENQRALAQINFSHHQGRKFLGQEAKIRG